MRKGILIVANRSKHVCVCIKGNKKGTSSKNDLTKGIVLQSYKI